MADDVMKFYVAGLQSLLTPPAAPTSQTRAGEAARPVSPYAAPEVDAAERFLQQSTALQDALWQQWQDAADGYERSKAEIQLLAAAAADLAIAERLLASEVEMKPATKTRSSTGGNEALIQQALTSPDQLLIPTISVPRGRSGAAAKKDLQAASFKCLEDIEDRTFKASKDVVEGLLAMPFAVVKEAAEMLGVDIADKLRETTVTAIKLAVNYILSASAKVRLLLGEQGEEQIKQGVTAFLEKLQDDKAIRQAIARFLDRDDIYEEGKGWVEAFAGEDEKLAAARDQIIALQGSFAGRAKIADVVVKGLAVIKLVPAVWTTLPWGPLAVAAAYLGVVGFLLYSALDHVDSDRFASFDRVHGVRGILKTELGVTSA